MMKTFIYVAHYDPTIDFNGAKIRVRSIAAAVTRSGYRFLFYRVPENVFYESDRLGNFQVLQHQKSGKIFAKKSVCAIIFSWFWISKRKGEVISSLGFGGIRPPIVLDTIDAVSIRNRREFIATGMQTATTIYPLGDEMREIDSVDFIVSITAEEQAYFRSMADKPGCIIGYSSPPDAEDISVGGVGTVGVTGFFGSQNYANYHSLVSSSQTAWCSGCVDRFIVAGSVCDYQDLLVRLRGLFGPWLEVVGRLDRIQEFYSSIEYSTNILAFGSGIKIKMVESLQVGVPTIANSVAAEGIPFDRTGGVYLAETGTEFVDAVSSLRLSDKNIDQQFLARRFHENIADFVRFFQ